MNTLYLRIKGLADKNHLSLAQLERELKFSNGIISTWKKGKASSDKIEKVADYFDVSTDYLLGRTDDPGFSSKDDEGFLRLNMTGFTDSEKDEVHQEIKDVIELAKRRFERRKNGK
ncbi:helix-turn-helix domain-containing protein [Pediococcus acidilactici]|uniref:helix-turn-helix domain-containing protein n=1 Tax=Pediococcus acidilactici TaxID=1254 RepID=UPI001F2C4816|nr:helix-turn-helix transcriptional regulator [Pediococcus acidilactici]